MKKVNFNNETYDIIKSIDFEKIKYDIIKKPSFGQERLEKDFQSDYLSISYINYLESNSFLKIIKYKNIYIRILGNISNIFYIEEKDFLIDTFDNIKFYEELNKDITNNIEDLNNILNKIAISQNLEKTLLIKQDSKKTFKI